MSDQMYRLDRSWTADGWPQELTEEHIAELNAVTPRGYNYVLRPHADPLANDRVELYEYVGENDE